MPKERPSVQRADGKPGRLRTLVRRSRSVLQLLSESITEERRREHTPQQAAVSTSSPEQSRNAESAISSDAERAPEVHTMPPPAPSAPRAAFAVPARMSSAFSAPIVERDAHCVAPQSRAPIATAAAHDSQDTLSQNLHARFGLIEQRFAILSDRLELFGDRVSAAMRHPERVHGTNSEAQSVQDTLQRLAERIGSLETRNAPAVASASKPFTEGTLRPPKVPAGLDVPLPPSPSAAPFGASNFGSSGFAERPSRPARKFDAGPTLSGTISALSLGSLFSLFEFERSTGTLSIFNEDRRLDLSLRGGSVVRCELDGTRTAASSAVREAFAWSSSTFSFQRDLEEDETEPPQSVNALMLEAMRYMDEERAG